MSTATASRHSCDSPEWYTPRDYILAAWEVMGGIDLDPASHAEANRIVGAKKFYTAEQNGLLLPWNGRLLVNPPGGKDAERRPLVNAFWHRLMGAWYRCAVDQAIWIGYSVEQLQTLQTQANGSKTPLDFPICFPRQRIAFIENEAKKAERFARLRDRGKEPTERSSPSHSGYVCYVGREIDTFVKVFSKFGQVKR